MFYRLVCFIELSFFLLFLQLQSKMKTLLNMLRYQCKLPFCFIFNYLTLFYQFSNCNITAFKSHAKLNYYDVYQCVMWFIFRFLLT